MPARSSSRRRTIAALATATALVSGTFESAHAAGPEPLPSHAVGVRYGWTPQMVAEYEAWLGAPVGAVTLFMNGRTDEAVLSNLRFKMQSFRNAPQLIVMSMPLVRRYREESLAQVANGSMDDLARAIATEMVAGGRGDDVIRLGWEFNMAFHAWSAVDDPAGYAAAFRRIVTVMRSVPGAQHLRFDWNYGCNGRAIDMAAYPGDEFVDVIGMDCYDRSYVDTYTDPIQRFDYFYSRPFGFKWIAEFAAERGKPIGLAEWGISSRHVDGAEPDNPVYIHRLLSWIAANDVAYFNYFESDSGFRHRLMLHYPEAAARYRYMVQEWLPNRLELGS